MTSGALRQAPPYFVRSFPEIPPKKIKSIKTTSFCPPRQTNLPFSFSLLESCNPTSYPTCPELNPVPSHLWTTIVEFQLCFGPPLNNFPIRRGAFDLHTSQLRRHIACLSPRWWRKETLLLFIPNHLHFHTRYIPARRRSHFSGPCSLSIHWVSRWSYTLHYGTAQICRIIWVREEISLVIRQFNC